jgi:hypothetical protein
LSLSAIHTILNTFIEVQIMSFSLVYFSWSTRHAVEGAGSNSFQQIWMLFFGWSWGVLPATK